MVVVVGVLWAVVKSFHMGWWDLENTTVGTPYDNDYYTIILLSRHLYDPHGCIAFDSIPRPPIESIDDLSHRRTSERKQTNTSKYTAPPNPRAIARGACGHSPSTNRILPGSLITTYGFPVSSQGVCDPWRGLGAGAAMKDTRHTPHPAALWYSGILMLMASGPHAPRAIALGVRRGRIFARVCLFTFARSSMWEVVDAFYWGSGMLSNAMHPCWIVQVPWLGGW